MKKVLVTLIALSLPAFALADETKGFYVQADAGHATVNWVAHQLKALASYFCRLRFRRFPCCCRLYAL